MARQAQFTVSLSKSSTERVSVNYATKDGTAVAPADYTAKSGTLVFEPGEVSKVVNVPIRDQLSGTAEETFSLELSSPSGGSIGTASGSASIPGDESVYRSRFNSIYQLIKSPSTGFFGPATGPAAGKIPYHALEELVVEAPDWGKETVSETASFYLKLEAWKAVMSQDATGYAAAWDCIENYYIPTSQAQPWDAYTPNSPAQYTPDTATLQETPAAGDTSKSVGPDPLYSALVSAYNTKEVYLMHWLFDVDGVYQFKNPAGGKTMVPINNFQRGPVEDGWATITHPCWDDYKNGGHPTYGWQPIYNRCPPLYSDAPANATYSAQWNYSVAPDAESRCIQAAWIASSLATGVNVSAYTAKAKKMADYMQYALYDKYFRPINGGYGGDGCHYLLSWGAGFGGGMPGTDHDSYWGFRIGNSEIHFGYNCVDVAYVCQTGKGLAPLSQGSGQRYAVSVNRQMELIRWLQSPEGPIAGGVTSNYKGVYGTPTDGRQTATFYGLYYTYSPSWHNPPSNDWVGYQVWGLERVTHLYAIVAPSTVQADKDLANNCAIILDKWMNWAWDNFLVDEQGVISMPTVLSWVETTAKTGTAAQPNTEGTYEYLPTQKWDGTGDYAAFWSGSSVPNSSLHCRITNTGIDLGIAAGFVQMVVQYCYAKKVTKGGLTGVIPGGTATYQQLLDRAIAYLDTMWKNYKDTKGFGVVEPMEAFTRMNDVLWIPPQFGTGTMPDGSILKNGQTTFRSMRKFYEKTDMWPAVEAYLAGGTVPSQKYHRFWANVDVAVSYAMLEKYFPETAASA